MPGTGTGGFGRSSPALSGDGRTLGHTGSGSNLGSGSSLDRSAPVSRGRRSSSGTETESAPRRDAALSGGGGGASAVGKVAAAVVGKTAAAVGRGLTLVHYSAQPEPLLSLKLNNYSPKKCSR